MKAITLSTIALVASAVAQSASASNWDMTFQGYGLFQTVGVRFNNSESWNSATAASGFAGVKAGQHNFSVYGKTYSNYCVQLFESVGNIGDTHEGDLAFSEAQKKFAYAKSGTLPGCCKACPYLRLCWGDCPKDRFTTSADGEPGLHYLCSGLKRFFPKATAARGELARRLQRP